MKQTTLDSGTGSYEIFAYVLSKVFLDKIISSTGSVEGAMHVNMPTKIRNLHSH